MAERKLYYTTNGVDPTNGSTPYSGSFAVNNGVTVKAVAYLDAWASLISSKVCAISIPSPTIVVGNMGNVSFTRINGDCYYTINGSTPTTASTKYTSGTVPVNSGTEIKAICVYRGGTSPVATETVTYSVPTPSISISKTGIVTVTKGSGDISGSVIRYTTNGSSPTTSSPVFSSLTATNGQNIKVASFYGGVKSGDASAWYYDAPTISAGGNVTISGASGAVIRYTTNGSEPNSSSSPQYTGAFTPSANTVIKAIQILNGFTSATRTAQFVAMPSVSVTGDGYVTITAGASTQIRYALNAVANGSSTVYTGGFYVDSGVTVNCIGLYNGGTSANRAQGVNYSIGAPTMSQNVWGEVSISKNVSGYPNSVIRYTTNGSEPTSSSPIWSGVPEALWGSTYKARNFYRNISSTTTSLVSVNSIPAPNMSIDEWGLVTVSGTYAGCVIVYDKGKNADLPSPVYTGPFDVDSNQMASACFLHTEKERIGNRVNKTVTFSVPNPNIGTSAIGRISMSRGAGDTPRSTIRYTMDGTDPTSGSTAYSDSFIVSGNAIIKARTFFKNVQSGVTTVYQNDAPVITNNKNGTITITGGLSGSTIIYSVSGYGNNVTDKTYTGTFSIVGGAATVTAYITQGGFKSGTTTKFCVYSVSAPTVTVDTNGLVTMSRTESITNSVLRYTTDGSEPTGSSTAYSGQFTISGTSKTIKAKTFNEVNSGTTTKYYTDPPTFSNSNRTVTMNNRSGTTYWGYGTGTPTNVYSSPFTASGGGTISLRGMNVFNGFTSRLSSHAIVVPVAPTIRFYDNDLGRATIHFSGSGSIRYTIDGTDPTTSSTAQTVGNGVKFLVVMDRTVKATVVLNGVYSNVTSKVYKMQVKYVMITTPTQSKVPVVYANFEQITRYTTNGTTPTDNSTILNSGTAYDTVEMRVRTKDVNTGEWLHEGLFANASSNSINWNADITEVKAVNSLADEIEIQLTPRVTGATYLYRADHYTPVRPNWTNSIQYKSDKPFSFRMPSGDTLSWLAIGSNGIGGAVYSFSGRCTVEI
ncbi:hypothetical protein BV741P4_00008 [Phocaeicola phage BV741P4]|nr:hypothetical protein BV741P4_00008 [Phocaeicola phage BV741P4]